MTSAADLIKKAAGIRNTLGEQGIKRFIFTQTKYCDDDIEPLFPLYERSNMEGVYKTKHMNFNNNSYIINEEDIKISARDIKECNTVLARKRVVIGSYEPSMKKHNTVRCKSYLPGLGGSLLQVKEIYKERRATTTRTKQQINSNEYKIFQDVLQENNDLIEKINTLEQEHKDVLREHKETLQENDDLEKWNNELDEEPNDFEEQERICNARLHTQSEKHAEVIREKINELNTKKETIRVQLKKLQKCDGMEKELALLKSGQTESKKTTQKKTHIPRTQSANRTRTRSSRIQ